VLRRRRRPPRLCGRLRRLGRDSPAEPPGSGPAAALRQTLQQRIGALSLPLPLGEQCTQRVDVDVTAGKKQASLSLRTRNAAGTKDSASIKLRCVAQAP
jgi:hypothetical protein